MKPRSLSELATATGGSIAGGDPIVTSVVVDSRLAVPGALFVALVGEHLDGHSFAEDAFQRGAAAVMVTHDVGTAGPSLAVADTLTALGRIAAADRADSAAKVIGITGSTGKTTTKDFLSAVLSVRFKVLASKGSFNNEIGLPLTLLEADAETEAIVCEMGARGVGHIAELCRVAAPDIGIVTNVGVAHLEMFGSRENIARSKGELIASLPADGVAVLAADDPLVRAMAELTAARVVTFGTVPGSDVRARGVRLDDAGLATFEIVAGGESTEATLAVPGEHMVQNALAAAAAGIALGIPLARTVDALSGARASSWRMETFVNPDGVTVVNDAYNANPQSMAAALKTCRWMARSGRMGAVLGRMAELGPIAAAEHERVGELAARLRVDRLVTVGEEARAMLVAAVREGVEPENAASYPDVEGALSDIKGWARRGDLVLFKGSRVTGLEKAAEAMR